MHRAGAEHGIERFREHAIETATRDETAVLIVNYSRRTLGQTGDGHFSPIGGYHAGSDSVLVLDTARFKYPPHWVSVAQLFAAMQAQDGSTGMPRGWIGLRTQSTSTPE
jgi:glutathione gamma-glutamylcysteinyltransferase